MISFLKNLIAPSFCASCRMFLEEETVLCLNCRFAIRPLVSKTIQITQSKDMVVHAIGAYDQPLVSLILAKSRGNRTVARQLGKLVWDMSAVSNLSYDCIVPIPLHWSRFAWRGYNQADEIGNVIAEKSNTSLKHILKRTRRTPYQSYFKGSERIANVQNVFALTNISQQDFKDQHMLLVDDVMTSGATLMQAAKTLVKLRPASITAIVVARVA